MSQNLKRTCTNLFSKKNRELNKTRCVQYLVQLKHIHIGNVTFPPEVLHAFTM